VFGRYPPVGGGGFIVNVIGPLHCPKECKIEKVNNI